MAWITTKSNARVERVTFEGKCATVVEAFVKNNGETGKASYSAFFDSPHGLEVGETGKFSGILGVKPELYDGKARANVTINSARFEPSDTEEF